MDIIVIWDVTAHRLVDKWWCFMESYCFHSRYNKIWTQAVEDFCATHI